MQKISWTFRVDKEELERWRAQAGEEGELLSEWIRRRCNAPGKWVVARVPVAEPESAKAQKRPMTKTCPHGIEKGWRCTLCGDVVA